MLKYFWSNFFRVSVCGLVCILVQIASPQEPTELLFPVPNGAGWEEIAADATVETRAADLRGDGEDFETLTRGPLHEAFAEPIVADPVPGLIVAIEPPPPINELMPEFRPDGDDAIWIAGYWGWDQQREDFIWISGVYRVPPAGHQWVPGYWHQVTDGWQWGQGFWVEDIAESIAYFPPPPKTLENGPSSPSPGVDYFYIPGNWSQSTNGFAWNSGYWHPMQDDLVWVPSHTVWTPRGCVYVAGYWDQRLPLRGLCFAPVSFSRVTYGRPGWYFRPSVVLNSQIVLQNLFVQPGYNHYLFGDYYGLPTANRTVFPAYVYHQRRGSCDPLISFYSAYNARQGQDMIRWYGNHHADLNRHPEKRPAQNWSPAIASGISGTTPFINQPFQLAHSLDQVNKINSGLRVSPVSENFRQDNLKRDGEHKQHARDRQLSERITDASGMATLALPMSETSHRSDDLNARRDKLPKAPRYIPSNAARTVPRNNDTLSLRPPASQPQGNFDLKGNDSKRFNPSMRSENSVPLEPGRIAPEVTRRIESIPKKLESKREGNRDAKPNEGTPQPGRILTPNQPRTFNSPRRLDVPRNDVPKSTEPNTLENNKPNRIEPNRIEANKTNRFEPNRLEPSRIKEQSRPMEQPKIQIPPPQAPFGNRQPMTEIRNRMNAQDEKRSTPLATPGARLGNRLLNDRANPSQNDAGKKPKK